MPTIYAANDSTVLVDGATIEGVQSIDYRHNAERTNVYALGSAERVGVVSGPISVEGRIVVASASPDLDSKMGGRRVQITAQLLSLNGSVTLSFEDCMMTRKSFQLSSGNHGEATYEFTATRVREEPS